MNKERKHRLQIARDAIDQAMNEEQDAYDNMPESIQNAERGENMQSFIDSMQTALDALDEVLEA